MDTPPSRLHVGINVVAIAAAVAVALNPGVGLVDTIRVQPLAGVPYLALLAVGVSLVFVALSSLPRTLALVPSAGGRR